ncbi:trypsin-like peptidase domain-containing protein [Planktothrix sp. FACHB-1375]|uniref:Trypsin-like peptidase domain-containing protein n=1 Tax=Aerosakkonema funiforme FACHB-1375 TaxID=2949571 RepID=A0A926VD74_9CYAN|nr:trypsin-like peptidase domain-containing protein [Aerosakkonema funiforme FACHB-1375]
MPLILACIGSLFLELPVQALVSSNSDKTPTPTVSPTQSVALPEGIIRDKARLISVRVLSVDRKEWNANTIGTFEVSGSGILLKVNTVKTSPHLPYLYLVLTNDHVAKSSTKESYIQTHDGLIHKGFLHPAKFDADLRLLYFYSPYRYETATLGKSSNLKENEKIYVAGFPCQLTSREMSCPAEFTFTQGEVFIFDQLLVDGYQIGYTNETKEGMSGGAVLNTQGQVVAINGRGKAESNNSQYSYADGSGSPEITQQKSLALGIPIKTYLNNAPTNPFDKLSPPKGVEYVYYTQQTSNSNNGEGNKNQFNLTNLDFIRVLAGIILLLILLISLIGILMLINQPKGRKISHKSKTTNDSRKGKNSTNENHKPTQSVYQLLYALNEEQIKLGAKTSDDIAQLIYLVKLITPTNQNLKQADLKDDNQVVDPNDTQQ